MPTKTAEDEDPDDRGDHDLQLLRAVIKIQCAITSISETLIDLVRQGHQFCDEDVLGDTVDMSSEDVHETECRVEREETEDNENYEDGKSQRLM